MIKYGGKHSFPILSRIIIFIRWFNWSMDSISRVSGFGEYIAWRLIKTHHRPK